MLRRSASSASARSLSAVMALLLVAVLGVRPGRGEESAPAASPSDLRARLDAYLAPLAAAGELSGNVFVAVGERPVYEASFGLANAEHGVPNTASTRYGIASITKPMTVIAAFLLVDEGKLSLEDPLSKFVPDFPRGDEITVGHLLQHQSGIPHRVTTEMEETVPRTAADMVRLVSRAELLFTPGSKTVYSSAGYSVLARVLEIASGEPYGKLLEDRVFLPAGALHSVDANRTELLRGRAEDYLLGAEGLVHAPFKDLSFLVGAGSVYSTARDLFAVQRQLLAGGYGESARSSLVREKGIGWNGSAGGFRAFADYHADGEITAIMTANRPSGAIDAVRAALPELVRGSEVDPPTIPHFEPGKIAPALAGKVEGLYQLRPGSELELRVLDATTVLIGSWRLLPTADGGLFSPQDWGRVGIVRDDDGVAVKGLEWGEGEKALFMPRVGPLSME